MYLVTMITKKHNISTAIDSKHTTTKKKKENQEETCFMSGTA